MSRQDVNVDNACEWRDGRGGSQGWDNAALLNQGSMWSRRLKLVGKWTLRGGLLVVILCVLYLSAAVLGACWTRNSDFVSAPEGVRIWIFCSDIHTDVIVPLKNDVFDWTTLLAREDAQDVSAGSDLLSIGWGDRTFFLETRTWDDVKVRNVLSAFCGLDETAMHVDWLEGEIREGERCRSLILSREQYAQLCRFMSESFVVASSGRALKIAEPGYGTTDTFYEAMGRYSAIRTCNSWAGEALAAGGVKVGIWTPMTWGVMWQIPLDVKS